MKEFNDLAAFARHLESVEVKFNPLKEVALEAIGQALEDAAKRKFGVYQSEDGPYDEWEPLKPATQKERERLRFSPNDPLYRTGDLMNSITHAVEGETVTVGSDSDIMVYQEMGTEDIPPRPVLGLAMYQQRKHIKDSVDELLLKWITDQKLNLKKY